MLSRFRKSRLWAKMKQGANSNKDLVLAIALASSATINFLNEIGFVGEIVGTSMQPTFNKHLPDIWIYQTPPPASEIERTNESSNFLSSLKKTFAMSSWLPESLQHLMGNESKRNIQFRHDRVLFNRWSVKDKSKINIGDVVILISPRRPEARLIKRVIALPGDTVHVVQEARSVTIDAGHCWVESDNQLPLSVQREDSNLFGQIPLGLITARASYVVWPPHRIGPVKRDPMAPFRSLKTTPVSPYRDDPPDEPIGKQQRSA